MGTFKFKRFEVRNEQAAMKVNTDGVLLGAAAPLRREDRQILDIGTGTGVIALMLAQRIHDIQVNADGTMITGIDIDHSAAEEAGQNFKASPWTETLTCLETGLASLERALDDSGDGVRYDLIVSNPPYYDSSLTNPDGRKATARHTGGAEPDCGLSFREVMDFAEKRLAEDGRLAIVLPADQEAALLRYGRMRNLHPSEIMRIRTVERKAPARIIVSFTKTRTETEEKMLTIMEKGKYTLQYISLTKDFYLFA